MPAIKNPVIKKARKERQDKRYDAVLKAYKEGASVPDIAEGMGLHRATVYQILSKGKK